MDIDDVVGVVIVGTLVGLIAFVLSVSLQPQSDPTTHTDPQTGCQYIIAPDGGITPRLDASGKPVCDHAGCQALSVVVL